MKYKFAELVAQLIVAVAVVVVAVVASSGRSTIQCAAHVAHAAHGL